LKLAKSLSKRGLRIVYYISPQLWAWRRYRLRTVRRYVDLLISILPFEKDWYAGHGVEHVEYVGSPLAREVNPTQGRSEFTDKYGLDTNRPIVALLPGSRHKEIVRIFPVMLETARVISVARPDIQFVAALASQASRKDVEYAIEQFGAADMPQITLVENDTFNALASADVAAVTSGTATLETGIIGTPMAIVYKTSQLNYSLLRPLISVDHFGLINLIADERVSAELIQDEFTPQTLSAELLRLLEPDANAAARDKLRAASDKLGHGGASRRAADAILRLIDG
jgi:lipid-A-disaccharide synthase